MLSKKYRADAYALVAYIVLALLLTFPLATRLTTHVAGDGSDDPALAWNLWWVPHASINLNTSPIHTDYMFYPIGLNLAFYTLTYLNAFLSIPIQYAFNVVVAANVNLWLSFVLSGFGAFLLIKYLLRSKNYELRITNFSAFAAGALYAFSSNKMLYAALGQFNIASSHWIPYYVLFLLKLTADRRPPTVGRITNYELRITIFHGFLLGLFLLFQALSEFIYASFLIIFTVIYLAYWLIANRRNLAAFRLLPFAFLLAVLVFIIPMSPILAAQISDMLAEGDFFQRGLGFADVFSNDALGFFVPSHLHPLFGNLETQFYFAYTNFAYLGYTAIFFALVALWRLPRARVWGAFAALFALLSLGPVLRVNGAPVFESPLFPFNWLLEIPFIKGNRYPSRWSVMVTLCLAILVGFGVAWLLQRAKRHQSSVISHQLSVNSRRRVLLITVYCLLMTVFLFDHLSIPLPTSNLQIPAVYQTIARDQSDFSVLEVPLAWRNGFRMTGTLDQAMMFAQFYQTQHRHPILGGNTSRNPELKFQYFTEAPVINSLIAVETGHTLDDAVRARDKQFAPAVLAFFGVQYVVWHSPRNPDNRPALDAARAYIESVLPVTAFYDVSDEQGDIAAYRVNAGTRGTEGTVRAGDALARLYFAEGWGALGKQGNEGNEKSVVWATRREAKMFWRLDAARDAMFSFRAFAPMPNQRVVVRVNERDACALQMKQGWGEYECRVTSGAWRTGMNQLIFQFNVIAPVADAREGNGFASLTTSFAIGKTGIAAPASIVVYSAGSEVGDFAHIYVDGVDASPNLRGYNVVVINPQSGAVETRAAFDTFAAEAESARLAQFIAQIPDGRIVAVAVRDEASWFLTEEAVNALKSIGAREDLRGKFRWSHAIIGVKGSTNGTANEYASEVMPAQLFVGIGALEPNVAAAVEWLKIE